MNAATISYVLVGSLLGWLASRWAKNAGLAGMPENLAVGVFGAFIGGEFIGPRVVTVTAASAQAFNPALLLMAALGAVAMLLLLGWWRHFTRRMPARRRRS